jgi:hypothetical protein
MTPEANEMSPPEIHPDAGQTDLEPDHDGEDQDARREIEKLAPSNERLRALIGTFQPPPGTFDDEEMPY